MLRKLIKHEWKSTYKVGCLMLFLMVLVTFFGWLSFQSPMWQAMSSDTTSVGVGVWDILSIFTLMLYVIMLLGVTYGIMIYMGVHFYKTTYTDEGYLLHTLPVTKHQILGSKILVSGLWTMFILCAVYVSLILLGASMIGVMIPEGMSFSEIWKEIAPEMDTILEMFKAETGIDLKAILVYGILGALVSPFLTMTIMFGAITLGQLFSKYRVVMAIVCYIGVFVVNSVVTSILQSISTANMMDNFNSATAAGEYLNTILFGSVIINLVEAIILYFAAHHICSKRLNME